MKNSTWIATIESALDLYFPSPPIPLIHKDPFTLLVAVVLSAQCTDARVNLVTPALFARADTAEKMAQLSVEEIRKLISSCGLSNTKAKNLQKMAEILSTQYAGQVPHCFADLERLPGVGRKTASVVMSQAFGIPAFPVDTHIFRSAHRWKLSTEKSLLGVENDLKQCFQRDKWNLRHLQIIYFCRKFCPAKGHQINLCPICTHLQAYF